MSAIMEWCMGVISKEKSLTSGEFAKRFLVNNHRHDRMDVSPLSPKLVKACSGFAEVFKVLIERAKGFQNSLRRRKSLAGVRVN